jgi:hypothetical protein
VNRQRLILLVLVILFGIAVFWSYRAVPRPRTVSSLTFKPGQQTKPAAAAANKQARAADDGSRVKISLLEQKPAGFKGYRRNLFKPVFVDEVKIVTQRPIVIKPAPQVPMPPVVPTIIQPEAAPLARFTFLGFLKKGAVKTIFLAKDNDILLVKKGDKFAGRYEATDISDQALTLTVTDTGGTMIIPLIEKRALAMPR